MPLQRILIVDSDPSAALVTQGGLQRFIGPEVTVTIAPSPGAARLRCLRGGVELLIVDPNPQSHAAAVLIKVLHDERSDVPILVLIAYDTPRLRPQMRALGVQDYLAKPVDLLNLVHGVRFALNREGVTSLGG
jgi:two-component system, OmpR family, response regulator